MDLLPTNEQQQIIDVAAAYLTDRLPLRRLRGLPPRPEVLSSRTWNELADLGWLGIGLDTSVGGVGCGPTEEILCFASWDTSLLRRESFSQPWRPTLRRPPLMVNLAGRLVGGDMSVALGVREEFGEQCKGLGVRRLYDVPGTAAALLIDGDVAQLVDISRQDLVEHPCLDSSIGMSVANLSGMPVLCQATDRMIGLRGALLLAAYQVGLAEKALGMIVEYAKIRETFGRPSELTKPCVTLRRDVARAEQAKAQVFLASVSLADGSPDAALQVSAARVLAERAALQNADDIFSYMAGLASRRSSMPITSLSARPSRHNGLATADRISHTFCRPRST